MPFDSLRSLRAGPFADVVVVRPGPIVATSATRQPASEANRDVIAQTPFRDEKKCRPTIAPFGGTGMWRSQLDVSIAERVTDNEVRASETNRARGLDRHQPFVDHPERDFPMKPRSRRDKLCLPTRARLRLCSHGFAPDELLLHPVSAHVAA